MVIKFCLIVNNEGGVKARVRMPAYGELSERELAIPLTLDIPNGWFSLRSKVVEIKLQPPT